MGLVLLALAAIFVRPTGLSFGCILAFVWLHLIGARWIYSFVPYDAVIQQVVGISISESEFHGAIDGRDEALQDWT